MAETRLFVIRHGNTFGPGDVPVRVGARTDIALVESGRIQARSLGLYFKQQGVSPDWVVSGELQRAQETARLMCEAGEFNAKLETTSAFNEIDYGPDEAKPEEEVVARVGQDAIDSWNSDAVVPPGWNVSPEELIANWREFAVKVIRERPGQVIMVVTSNGIARFAPHLTGDFERFKNSFDIKLKTGAFGEFVHDGSAWTARLWNVRPA